jgi:IS5 family transposase
MSERDVSQMSFADGLLADGAGANALLDRVVRLVEWGELEALLSPLYGGRMGAPAYPALALFRALLLQQWYGLSDPQLEEALGDRLSFRRFIGFSLSEHMPDHATLWRFRERLAKGGLAERAFAIITAQIEQSGFVLKRGSLIDATLIRSAVNAPPPPSDPPVAADGRPGSKLVSNPADPQAAWTKKQGRRFFGYKAHLAMDLGSRIIRRAIFTPANVNDTVPADHLICGDEHRVYADKAYDSQARRQHLKAQGIRNGIMRRGHRCHSMSQAARRRNKMLSRIRAPIEPLFALLKNVYHLARARYRGLIRNTAALHLAVSAINLKRWASAAPA